MKYLVKIILFICAFLPVFGYNSQDAAIKDARFKQDRKGRVHIYYDLVNPNNDRYFITLKFSDDGGDTFFLTPASVQGDIGENISGQGKKYIIWEVEKDAPDIKGHNFVFSVEAEEVYVYYFNKGKENAEQGNWDGAIVLYQKALKYKPGDSNAENEIKFVRTKKEEEARKKEEEEARKKKEEEESRKKEETRKKEEQRQQKIADSIEKGKKYLSQEKYSSAVDEFQNAINLGASGEVTELLVEAKKKMYEVQQGEWRIIDDDLVIVGTGGGNYLMWPRKKDSAGCHNDETLNWSSAMSWSQKLVYKGYDDWRMPTKDELKQLYDYGKTYITYASSWYWSSSEHVSETSGAWLVHFDDGRVYCGHKSNGVYVRPVRGSP